VLDADLLADLVEEFHGSSPVPLRGAMVPAQTTQVRLGWAFGASPIGWEQGVLRPAVVLRGLDDQHSPFADFLFTTR
jgi:hypothetical protein